jgi:hypothetical protein
MHSVEWLFRGIFRCTKERTGIPMGKAPESHETVINSNLPQTGDGDRRQEIVEELERVLHGKHFRNSGRAKQFLQFIVERKLDGHSDDLKERTLGTEVFNRPPDYSTGDDPVVRVQAGLVRRRLEQHYQEAQENSRVRIELPLGSYAPKFQWFNTPSVEAVSAEGLTPEPLTSKRRFLGLKSLIGLMVAAVLIASAGVVLVRAHRTDLQKSVLEQFWAPALAAQQPVLLCLANGVTYRPKPELYERYARLHPGTFATQTERANRPLPLDPSETITWGDLISVPQWGITRGDLSTAVRLASFFGKMGKPIELRVETEYSFRDLRASPAVLVGAFNNEWTMNLISDLRFAFVEEEGRILIRDKGQTGHFWPPTPLQPMSKSVDFERQDFAIIGRLRNSKTGQFTVIVGGLTSRGTEAAAEFISNQSDIEKGLRDAPRDWQSKNLELVLEAKVTEGVSGPPQIVAAYYW